MNFSDPTAAEVTRAAEAYATEVLANVGKLWTRERIARELVTAYCHAYCHGMRDTGAVTLATLAPNKVAESPASYDAGPRPVPMRTSYGFAVQIHAGAACPPPSVQDILRTCEPSPALVKLLADSATQWAKAGRLDDAAAALALGLCARSAWLSYTSPPEPEDTPR